MKICVCVKQVPDSETKVRLVSESEGLDLATIKWVMNPYDEFAVEEALKIRDRMPGSQVIALSLGPDRVLDTLRTALAMGADEAVHVVGDMTTDSTLVGLLLAKAIEAIGGVELVLGGKQAIDMDTHEVPTRVAVNLGFSVVSDVSKLEFEGTAIKATRDIDGGGKECYRIEGPAVLSVTKGINIPRYPSLPGIMKAKKKNITRIPAMDLVADAPLSVAVVGWEMPPERGAGKVWSGEDLHQSVRELVKALHEDSKVV